VVIMEVVRIHKQDSKKIKEPVLILIFCPKENWSWCFSHYGILEKPELTVIRKSNTYSTNARLVPIRRKEGRNSKLELLSLSFCFSPPKRNPEAAVLGLWNNFKKWNLGISTKSNSHPTLDWSL
jgi:hypothetical protein